MAVLASADFETGDTSQLDRTFYNGSSTISVQAGAALHGSYGLRAVIETDGSYAGGMLDVADTPQELFVRITLKFPSDISLNQYGGVYCMMIADNTNIWSQTTIASLYLARYGSGSGMPDTLVASGSGISQDVAVSWESGVTYTLEMRWKRHATAGEFEAWVDGEKLIDLSGLDTDAYQAVTVNVFRGASGVTGTTTVYIDDVVVADSYIGPVSEGGAAVAVPVLSADGVHSAVFGGQVVRG